MKRFKDKNILVTAGAKGIGEAIVKRFIREGARVFFTYNTSRAKAQEIEENTAGDKAKAYKLDVTDYKKGEALVKKITREYGGIDILVNNAGIAKDKPISEMSIEDFNEVIDVDLAGVFNMSKIVISYMMLKKKGVIVNISSVAAIKGGSFQISYSAAKSGILGLTRSLAKEVARFNINVNSVCPGFIRTDMFNKMPPFARANGINKVPLGRIGQAEEVAGLVAYLSSKEASYITGQFFIIDGGLSI